MLGRVLFPSRRLPAALAVKGGISTMPNASKSSQFISIRSHPCDIKGEHSFLYEVVNQLFDRSDFGLESAEQPIEAKFPSNKDNQRVSRNGQGNKRMREDQKGIDRWPIFYLRLDFTSEDPRYVLGEICSGTIVDLLERLIYSWLERHHFRPCKIKNKSSYPREWHSFQQFSTEDSPSSVIAIPLDNTSVDQERPSTSTADWSHARRGASSYHGTAARSQRPLSSPASHYGSITFMEKRTAFRLDLAPLHVGQLSAGAANSTIGSSAASAQAPTIPEPSRSRSKWFDGIMESWVNPCFRNVTPDTILTVRHQEAHQFGCCHTPAKARKETDHGTATQLSKTALKSARVVGQVDRKYILATVPDSKAQSSTQVLLIDQHAASERCILEELLDEFCRPASTDSSLVRSKLGLISSIPTVKLKQKMGFCIPSSEHSGIVNVAPFIARWGVLYNIRDPPSEESPRTFGEVSIISLPPGIAQRCIAEPKLVEKFIRNEAQSQKECKGRVTTHESPNIDQLQCPESSHWVGRIGACPQGIVDLLNSRACRSAIMFNDPLSLQECQLLVKKLSRCSFPFICAHGRVSIVPLVILGPCSSGATLGEMVDMACDGDRKVSFVDAFRRWRRDER